MMLEPPRGLQGPRRMPRVAKGGGNGHRKRRQTHARGEGHIEERRRLVGGRCGLNPYGRRSAQGEDSISKSYRERCHEDKRLLMGGGGRIEEGN